MSKIAARSQDNLIERIDFCINALVSAQTISLPTPTVSNLGLIDTTMLFFCACALFVMFFFLNGSDENIIC